MASTLPGSEAARKVAPLVLVTIAALVALSACGQSPSGMGGAGGTLAAGGGSGTGGTSSTVGGSSAGGSGATGGTASGGTAGSKTGQGGSSGGAMGGASGGTTGVPAGGALGTGGSTAGGAAGRVPENTDGGPVGGSRDSGTPDRSAEVGGGGAMGGSGGQDATGAGGRSDAGVDPNKKIKVWLAGDSTMMSCTGSCPCGWGSQLQSLLSSNATVVNSAVGGRSIQTWLYDPNVTTTMGSNGECVVDPKTYSSRWQAMIDPASGMKAGDYLLVQFGINDGDSTCNRHVGTTLFQTYLGAMADAAKQLGAQPVFLTSTSYIGCSGSTATTNRGFVAETKAAGKANEVPVIDLTALSAALYNSLGLCPNSGDYTSTTSAVGKLFCEDHTHFEASGALEIAKVVAKAIKDQGIGLAAYLR